MTKYETILNKDFFEQHADLSSKQLQKLVLADHQLEIDDRIIRYYRQRLGLGKAPPKQAQMIVVDKVHKEPFSCNTVREYYSVMRDQRKQLINKQKEVTITPPDTSKYLGVAVIGDLHLGSEFTNEQRLFDEQELIRETANVIAVQVGDILNNEASFSHRGKTRVQPLELPLDIQRALAKDYFNTLKDKMAAFIIGNHDYRSLITESYDFGEVLADEIRGAYLGFRGDVIIQFAPTLYYRLHLTHDGKGYSYSNPTYQGLRVANENHHLDIVCFGHIHDDVAYMDLPIGAKDHRAVIVRSGGYQDFPSSYTDFKGYPDRPTTTPLLILAPDKKYIRVERDIYEGVKTLRALNGE